MPQGYAAAMLLDSAKRLALERPLQEFAAKGFARLGRVLSAEGAARLGSRADELMLGTRTIPGLFFQHDSPTGRYEDLEFGKGWVGPSRAYRKLEKLERDPLFGAWVENPLFGRIARAMIGADVALYRTVLWNKRAEGGMDLPWHQDDGRFWGLDRSPLLQIWTALDDAPIDAGCVEVVPGTHHAGLATPQGGTIPDAVYAAAASASQSAQPLQLPVRAGEALLIHNHVWHRSGRNHTKQPRRALGISYVSAATRCTRTRRAPRRFQRVFASGLKSSVELS